MKRILSAAAALSVFAFAQQADAADFILSGNSSNALFDNFKLTYQDATDTTASLSHQVGITASFTDRFIFAPIVGGIGSGAATAAVLTGMTFTTPSGISIAGYALTPGVGAALLSAFGALDYTAAGTGDLTTLQTFLSGLPPVLYSQAGGGDAFAQSLNNVPLNAAYFYVITITGAGTKLGSRYDGNLASTSVPEPATWALMLAGFGAIGFAMRRRRKPQPKVRFAF